MNTPSVFESIRQLDVSGNEYWSARELATVLSYKQWRNFEIVVEKAKVSCKTAWQSTLHHFAEVSKMIELAKWAEREVNDYHLSRYTCYLIAQNGDPRKEVIARAQMYFASQTRKQEILEEYKYESKRIHKRDEITEHNKRLMSTAAGAGVANFAQFNNAGYQGLYGWLTQEKIHRKKQLKPHEKILDHMGYAELAANDFRITQTDEAMTREHIQGQMNADKTHYAVGKEIRETIKKLGNTPLEDLPVHEDIKKVKKKIGKVTKELE